MPSPSRTLLYAALAITLIAPARPASAKSKPAAPAPPSAKQVLEQVRSNYRDLWSYELSGRLEIQLWSAGGNQENVLPFLIAADSAGRFREQLGSYPAAYEDGRTQIQYRPEDGRYTRRSATRRPVRAGARTGEPADGFAGRWLSDLRSASSDSGATIVREQTVTLEGRPRECWVIETPSVSGMPNVEMSPRVLWVDKQRSLILMQRLHIKSATAAPGQAWERTETIALDRARVNEAAPDTLFSFRAPPGSKEVTSLDPQGVDLTGQEAADFTLRNLDGKPVSLKSLRGQVVVLDFWATWCGPCRIEMPRLENLHKELKGKGLVVLGINQRETAQRARSYVEKSGYTFPILLDEKGEASDLYQVQAIPTLVVVDPKGRIAAHFIGLREESVLREAVTKARGH
jgi:peroxiredoxin